MGVAIVITEEGGDSYAFGQTQTKFLLFHIQAEERENLSTSSYWEKALKLENCQICLSNTGEFIKWI